MEGARFLRLAQSIILRPHNLARYSLLRLNERVPVGETMRRLAQTVALLSVPLAFAACGDDVPSNVDATVIFVYPDGGIPETGAGGGDAGCPSASFLSPVANANLTAANDKNGDSCADGFQIDVQLAVGAVNGTPVTLLANNTPVGSGVVTNGVVTFEGVALGTQGAAALVAQISSIAGCSVTNNVMVNCTAVSCNITKPVISESHPKLNDIPVAEGGDRVSSPGSDYQAAFEVTTNAPDNSVVSLQVRRADAPEAIVVLSATSLGGKANFPGVTMRPDGQFQVQAVCRSGEVEGRSQLGTYTIDTTKPELTITAPIDGQFFGPNDLTDGKFQVCATTTSPDAVGLGTALPRMGRNLGAGIGMSLEFSAVAAAGAGGGNGCVAIACNGGAPFDLNVQLYDDAGNRTVKTIQGVRCSSTLPSVQIVSPTGDAEPYGDITKRLLATSSDQPLKDADPTRTGAQTMVVACTDKANAKAVLKVGVQGTTLLQVGDEVTVQPAQQSDNCSLGYVAKWDAATLQDSTQNANGTIQSPTELVVEVTDISTAKGASPPVRLWVDSLAPTLTELSPSPLCGTIFQSTTDWTVPVRLVSTTSGVTLTVVGPNETKTYPVQSQTGLTLDFGTVTFAKGDSEVSARAVEPSGNAVALQSPCTVKVGEVPVVTWTAPAVGMNLCATGNNSATCLGDADANTAGWQGSLKVSVVLAGAPATAGTVTFSVNGTDVGVANIDGTGVATLSDITINDAAAVSIKATTSDISGTGTGSATRSVKVDTTKPSETPNLAVDVKERRQTSFHLDWDGASDAGAKVTSYLVRVSGSPIDEANFGAAEAVLYAGSPADPGATDGIDVLGRQIAKDYYFAVQAVDSVGNRGPVSSVGPKRADFLTVQIPAPTGVVNNERFGNSIDGSEDLDGDGKSDILVGSVTGQRAYILFGATEPNDLGDPMKSRVTVLKGLASSSFGRAFINIGDIDGDKKNDIAISASLAGIGGKVYILKGRTTWAAEYDVEQAADYIIDLGSASYANTRFGESMARIGNFDGDADGTDDLAIGAFGYGGNRGRVVIVLGKKDGISGSNPETVVIDGDPAQPTGRFGERIIGLGNFYAGAGSSLAVASLSTANSTGRVFTFQGLPASATAYSIAEAKHSVSAPNGASLYGVGLGITGTGGGTIGLALGGDGNLTGIGDGFVDLWFGTEQTGPFSGTPVRLAASTTTSSVDDFGRLVFGSAFPGTTISSSLVGDASADLVLVPRSEGGSASSIYIIDGSTLRNLSSPTNVVTQAVARIPLPSDWKAVALYQRNGTVRDVNGDGYADIAVGEYSTGIAPNPQIPGRVFLIW